MPHVIVRSVGNVSCVDWYCSFCGLRGSVVVAEPATPFKTIYRIEEQHQEFNSTCSYYVDEVRQEVPPGGWYDKNNKHKGARPGWMLKTELASPGTPTQRT